jgi:hypothetical protein
MSEIATSLTKLAVVGLMPKAELTPVFSLADCASAGPDASTKRAEAGYGANFADLFRHAGDFVNKILRATKAADLPVQQPTKFDLGHQSGYGQGTGFDDTPILLLRADEVIE